MDFSEFLERLNYIMELINAMSLWDAPPVIVAEREEKQEQNAEIYNFWSGDTFYGDDNQSNNMTFVDFVDKIAVQVGECGKRGSFMEMVSVLEKDNDRVEGVCQGIFREKQLGRIAEELRTNKQLVQKNTDRERVSAISDLTARDFGKNVFVAKELAESIARQQAVENISRERFSSLESSIERKNKIEERENAGSLFAQSIQTCRERENSILNLLQDYIVGDRKQNFYAEVKSAEERAEMLLSLEKVGRVQNEMLLHFEETGRAKAESLLSNFEKLSSENRLGIYKDFSPSRLKKNAISVSESSQNSFRELIQANETANFEKNNSLIKTLLKECMEKQPARAIGDVNVNVDFKAYAQLENNYDVESFAKVFSKYLESQLEDCAEGLHF